MKSASTGTADAELQVLEWQVELAAQRSELVLVHTPHLEDKLKGTRLIMDVIRNERRLDPGRVLIDHAEEHTVAEIRERGFWAAPSLDGTGTVGQSGRVSRPDLPVPDPMVTYCTNVHPGDTWAQIRANVRYFIPQVKRAVSPDAPFLIGLRLSAQAAAEITPRAAAAFLEWCRREKCFVATINGFPFGSFHGGLVKEQAYLPDWRDTKRSDYTRQLIALLRLWLPEGVTGSISTVPVGYRDHIRAEELDTVRENLLGVLEDLAQSATAGHQDRPGPGAGARLPAGACRGRHCLCGHARAA